MSWYYIDIRRCVVYFAVCMYMHCFFIQLLWYTDHGEFDWNAKKRECNCHTITLWNQGRSSVTWRSICELMLHFCKYHDHLIPYSYFQGHSVWFRHKDICVVDVWRVCQTYVMSGTKSILILVQRWIFLQMVVVYIYFRLTSPMNWIYKHINFWQLGHAKLIVLVQLTLDGIE